MEATVPAKQTVTPKTDEEALGEGDFDLVKIRWMDAKSSATWHSISDIPRTTLVTSVGYLVAIDDHSMTIAATMAHDSDVDPLSELIAIPKAWISEVIILEPKDA